MHRVLSVSRATGSPSSSFEAQLWPGHHVVEVSFRWTMDAFVRMDRQQSIRQPGLHDTARAELAEFGRDLKAWKKVKEGAMRGWIKCSDGKLHHAVVAEGVLHAWERRFASTKKAKAAASKRWGDKDAQADAPAVPGAMPRDAKRKGEGEGREKEASVSLRSTGDGEAAAPSIEQPSIGANAPTDEVPPIDDMTRLWRDGLKILRLLCPKYADGQARKMLGKWVDLIGGDHAGLLDILQGAEVSQPDQPVPWIRAAITHHVGQLPLHVPEEDPYGVRAWAARQPDAKGDPVSINGCLVEVSAEIVADAIGISKSWRGNWDALGAWLRDDLDISAEPVLRALAEQAGRMGGNFRSIAAFDGAVRHVAKSAMPA
jgi:hypothetical protein